MLYTNKGPIQFFAQPWLNPGLVISNKIVFDRLLTADGSLVPTGPMQLAESYEVSEDGMSVTFDLKDGLTWHDGVPLTADDISWSIHTATKFPSLNGVSREHVPTARRGGSYAKGEADSISGIGRRQRSRSTSPCSTRTCW